MRHLIVLLGLFALAAAPLLTGCVRGEALEPPAQVQLACGFGEGQPTMSLVLDTGLETATWLNLAEPRQGRVRVAAHQYQLDFPAVGRTPAVRARIDRYDATITRTVGVGAKSVSKAGRCAKEKAGPRL